MPKVFLIIKGTPSDHDLVGPAVLEDDARRQLADVSEAMRFVSADPLVSLPWVTVRRVDIVAVGLQG